MSQRSIAFGFERVLKKSEKCVPVLVQSDEGKEFVAQRFQRVLKENGIDYTPGRSPDVKASVAQRFMHTIKQRLWRYFTHRNTHCYVDVLPNLVESYNNSRHSATKMAPSAVTLENAAKVRKNLIKRYAYPKLRAPKHDVGNLVRIIRLKNVF